MTAVSDDVVVVSEHSVGEPVVAHELPDVFHDVQLRTFRWQWKKCDVVWHDNVAGKVPACLVEKQHSVPGGGDHFTDFGQMQVHRRGVAEGQRQRRSLAVTRADSTEDIDRSVALVLRRRWPGPAPRPSAGDAILLAHPGLVGEPDFYRVETDALLARDARQRGREFYGMARPFPACRVICRGPTEEREAGNEDRDRGFRD